MVQISETVKVLIVVNVLFFIGSVQMPELTNELFNLHYFKNPAFKFWQPITHMFMHADLRHLGFNMLSLYMFGSAMERAWGQKKFIFFYFSAGLGAALISTLVNHITIQVGMQEMLTAGITQVEINQMLADGMYIPKFGDWVFTYFGSALGASGAVYGIIVAFAWYFPNVTLWPIPIPVKFFVPAMLLGDLIFGFSGAVTGIGHWAHIGGALFGFIMAYVWKKNSFNNTRLN